MPSQPTLDAPTDAERKRASRQRRSSQQRAEETARNTLARSDSRNRTLSPRPPPLTGAQRMETLRHNQTHGQRVAQRARNADAMASTRLPTAAPPHEQDPPPWWVGVLQQKPKAIKIKWREPCKDCSAVILTSDKAGSCCRNGSMVVPRLAPYPADIAQLLHNQPAFLTDKARMLNRAFNLAVIGCSNTWGVRGHGDSVQTGGPWEAAITGRTYHRLLPSSNNTTPLHWLLYDEIQTDYRNNLDEELIDLFRVALRTYNPIYRELEAYRIHPDQLNSVLEISIKDHPHSNEVAALIRTANQAVINPRAFYVYDKDHPTNPKQINILSPLLEPLSYPVLFLHGELGWSPGFRSTTGKPMTMMAYYRARLMQEEDRFAAFYRAGAEYFLDGFSRVADNRLDFIRQSKSRERALESQWEHDGYEWEREGCAGDDEFPDNEFDDTAHLSEELPASYLGSPRWAAQQVADTIALAKKGRQPTFMVTATTNDKWPEIQERVRPGFSAKERMTVMLHAFRGRLAKLMEVLKKMFGGFEYIIKVVEFQKRGRPHAHIIIRVEPQLQLKDIDCVISAEMPDPLADPELYNLVKTHMMHPKNHLDGHYSRCNKNGTCSYNYPHPIRPFTTVDENGRPLYRRRTVDDAWVVPHCPPLLRLWQGHINVEVVSTSDVLAYLYKYLHKGADTVVADLNSHEPVNEISEYINARYLSSTEACWRLLGFNITRKEPAVLRLPVHPQHRNRPQYAQKRKQTSDASLLMRYFARPREPPFDTLTYVDFYEQYRHVTPLQAEKLAAPVWQEAQLWSSAPLRCIVNRVRHPRPVARIQSVPLGAGEVFYIRCLLARKPAYHWDDLRLIDDISYPTFAEAAEALGIFHHGDEPVVAMCEAIECEATPGKLRRLFGWLIMEDANAVTLWAQFSDQMSNDFSRRLGLPPSLAKDEALRKISSQLMARNRSLEEFGLPVPPNLNLSALTQEYQAFAPVLSHLRNRALSNREVMTDPQRRHYDLLLTSFTHDTTTHTTFFIEGMAGRGKSFVTVALVDALRGSRLIVLIAGSTAKSVQGYQRGRTMHSLFHLPVTPDNSNVQSRLLTKPDHPDAVLIREAHLIILEELPMANKSTMDAIDELLCSLMKDARPFGGKRVLGVGDFRQVAPVVKGAYSETEVLDASIRTSPLWDSFKVLTRTPPFEMQTIRISARSWTSIAAAVDFLYPHDTLLHPEACLNVSFLSPVNVLVDAFNADVLLRVPGLSKCYRSFDSIKEGNRLNTEHADLDFLAHLDMAGTPSHELTLKPNVVCVLMRNLDVAKGLVKNARLLVKQLHRRVVEVSLLQNQFDPTGAPGLVETTHFIPRITFEFQPRFLPFTVCRRQFPLRLAYATTFNSCQGLTLERAVLDLRVSVFAHGQLYTALSRVRSRHCLKTLLPEGGDSIANNVVYSSLLLCDT